MDWARDNLWGIWLAVAMLLGVAELFSLDLVLLMLATGALVGMGLDLAGLDLWVQLVGALATSVAMLALVRPNVVRKLHGGPDLKHGFTSLIGREAFALSEVSQHGGQVKLAGEVWSARPYDDGLVIPAGAKVEVFEIRGATAYVHPLPELEP
jgi:membrane protein implicated in regulation of membrane protease activity